MSASVADQFFSLLRNRRLDDVTLRVLESVLVRQDVKTSLDVISSLSTFLRSESLSVIRDATEKSVEQKLLVLEFFVRAFALIGDVKNCLALRYEALILREFQSGSNQLFQVSCSEWLEFADNSLDAGFFSITGKACENALSSFHRDGAADPSTPDSFEVLQATEKIKRLKHFAQASVASHSVQAQAVEYLKTKIIRKRKTESSIPRQTQYAAAKTLFRNGIKQRNARKLRERQLTEDYKDFR